MKNYHELVQDRIYIGGADDAEEAVKHETIDLVFDLRAESPKSDATYSRIHSPIVDNEGDQDDSIKASIEQVVTAYKDGKNIYFHCQGGSNRTGTVAVGTLLELGFAETLEEAEAMAQESRPKINVKPEMMESLRKLYPNK
ncbi:dual specificity protein phosphatase family protein [Rossellomorea vietnamensis]|uniref:Dual specificity protein phosphatase family protein n=1 Tax=Rossellomorea vietnamensis TaxID=218284 RepID=A0ACD4CCB1_9BACI|nr:dual specificity protein phosphatase family protein [Rossellomorea vietnamensis]UXH46248.1 dual specificity protein phosphatase family protein [Rossellomorea vietnamensis]